MADYSPQQNANAGIGKTTPARINVLFFFFLVGFAVNAAMFMVPALTDYVFGLKMPYTPPIAVAEEIQSRSPLVAKLEHEEKLYENARIFFRRSLKVIAVFIVCIALGMGIWLFRNDITLPRTALSRFLYLWISATVCYMALLCYQEYRKRDFLRPEVKYQSIEVAYNAYSLVPKGRIRYEVHNISSYYRGQDQPFTIPFKKCSFSLIKNVLYFYTAQNTVGYTHSFGGVEVKDIQNLPLRFGTESSPYMALLVSFNGNNRLLLMIFHHDKGLLYESLIADNSKNMIQLFSVAMGKLPQQMCMLAGDSLRVYMPTDIEGAGNMKGIYDIHVQDFVEPINPDTEQNSDSTILTR